MSYVAIAVEHMRDGQEEYAKCFHTLETALEWIDGLQNGFGGDCHSFQLFELGKEIKLKFDKVMEPQPAKEVKKTVAVLKEIKEKRS